MLSLAVAASWMTVAKEEAPTSHLVEQRKQEERHQQSFQIQQLECCPSPQRDPREHRTPVEEVVLQSRLGRQRQAAVQRHLVVTESFVPMAAVAAVAV